MKSLQISGISYEMLLELSKKNRKKPEEYVDFLIKEQYKKVR